MEWCCLSQGCRRCRRRPGHRPRLAVRWPLSMPLPRHCPLHVTWAPRMRMRAFMSFGAGGLLSHVPSSHRLRALPPPPPPPPAPPPPPPPQPLLRTSSVPPPPTPGRARHGASPRSAPSSKEPFGSTRQKPEVTLIWQHPETILIWQQPEAILIWQQPETTRMAAAAAAAAAAASAAAVAAGSAAVSAAPRLCPCPRAPW